MTPANEYENLKRETPGRLIDEIVTYIQERQKSETNKAEKTVKVDEERLFRATLRHLRHNPIPTALLGISTIWLLLADEDATKEPAPELGPQIEDEIIKQAKGGYDYTRQRLRKLVDQYPWTTATALVGGGLLAALFFPESEEPVPEPYPQPEPVEDETMPGEDYGFEPMEEEEEDQERS